MLGKLCLAIFGALLVRSAVSLRCQTGYDITSNLINKRKWTENECAHDESVCEKYQGEIIVYNSYRIQVTVGLCAKQTTCETNCTDDRNKTLVTGFSAASGLHTADINNIVTSCRRACCENDNCNEKDIGEIITAMEAVATLAPLMREIVSTRTNSTTTAPTTTLSDITSATTVVTTSTSNSSSNPMVSVDDFFECEEGFEITNSLATSSSWNTTLCNRSLQQKCIRGEGTVIIYGTLEISVVTAFCANQNLCDESCNELLSTSLVDLEASEYDYTISSCRRACCDSNHCNNQTVDQIESSSIEPSTIVSTIQTNLQETILPLGTRDFFECSSGYEIVSEFWNISSFTTTLCRKSLGHKCSRAEGVVLVSEVIEVNMVTTFCGQENECGNSCDELFTLALAAIDPAFTDSSVVSCNRTCCNAENCNNKTIVQIETEKLMPTTMLPTTPPATIATTATSASTISTASTTTSTNALQCTTGYKIESTFLNDESWAITTCESSTPSCIKSEILASIFNNSFEIRLQIATCVDRSVCQQTCSELTRSVFFSSGRSSDSEIRNLDLDSIDLRMCDFVCCENGNCNNDSIANINRSLGPSSPPVLPPPEVDIPETLECFSGYIVESDFFNYNNWSLIQCPESAQKCVRADSRATLYGVATANITVGFCANTSQCDNQVCNNLLGNIAMSEENFEIRGLTTDEFELNFCHSTCCNTNGCNNQSVSELPETLPPTTFTLPDGHRRAPTVTPPTTNIPASPERNPDTPIGSGCSSSSNATSSQSQHDCSTSTSCQNQPCNFGRDEDTLFVLSLVPRLRNLPPRIASEVKMRFLETIHEAQFGNLSIR